MFHEREEGDVPMVDHNVCKDMEIGTIFLKLHDDRAYILYNVPDIRKNILSLGYLDWNFGYRIIKEGEELHVLKDYFVVMKGIRQVDNLYYIYYIT